MGVLSIRRGLAGALLLPTLPMAVLPAQRLGGVEVGAFGALASFAPRFDLRAGLGGGGRIAYFLRPSWALELEVGAQRATVAGGGSTVPITLAAIQVLYGFAGEQATWYALAGYARPTFHGTPPGRFGDDAMSVGVGRRTFLGSRLALRGEARGLYSFSSSRAPGTGAGHLLATFGLSYFMAGSRRLDADGDGVPDHRDICPQTPHGAAVDEHGCPTDSDADGHFDGLDRCPNTPFGAYADTAGCPVDSDRDGVYDGLDQCPNTPSGASVDVRGCSRDVDGDGVDDARDRCPNTPSGVSVDESGCPKDSDGDGVLDGRDRCPGTPPRAVVDASGCSVAKDSDGDRVDDARDKCPGTPPGTPVDSLGCQILFRSDAEGEALILTGVTFELGKSRLLPASSVALTQVAASLIAHPDVRNEIAGYTDSTGSASLNTRLSAARAQAVRAYLARRGVAPTRMRARGYGPASPVAPNATPDGRALNRRVELHRLF